MNRFLFGACALLLTTTVIAQSEPVEIVRETSNELFGQIELRREHFEDHPEALEGLVRELMLPQIDVLYSGRLVLGRAARGVERQKVIDFSDALSDLLIEHYASGLLDFRTRNQIEVLPLAGDNSERMTKVRTRVTLNNGKVTPVDYVFRKTDGGWLIFDVIVEGISYVATFRNQIGEQIRQSGFDATLERILAGRLDLDVDDA